MKANFFCTASGAVARLIFMLPCPELIFYFDLNSVYIELLYPNTMALNPIKLEHFRNLVSLIAADGKIEDVERVALSKIAYERGIPLDRFTVMLDRADEYKYLIPQNHHDREKQLEEMLEVAMVDGEFAVAEFELIAMVAEKLGFTKEQLDEIIKTFKSENNA
jgi:uncharacterized tellurite resistance protein B-like protein